MDSDQPDLVEMFKAPPPPLKIVPVLWKMQGPARLLIARIERHPYRQEPVIAFDEIIETRLDRSGTAGLEQRAPDVRELLRDKGWVEATGRVG